MQVRVWSWAGVLLLHGLLIVGLADIIPEPDRLAAPLPVLTVDMLAADRHSSTTAPVPAARSAPSRSASPPPQARQQTPPPVAPRPAPSRADKKAPSVSAPSLPESASMPRLASPDATPPATSAPASASASGGSPASAPPVSTSAYIPADYAASNRKPDYPSLSRRYGEQGTVVLRVLVGANGRAQQVELHSSSGHALLDQSAKQAVQNWRFAPATRHGQPVSDWFLVPIPFKLQD